MKFFRIVLVTLAVITAIACATASPVALASSRSEAKANALASSTRVETNAKTTYSIVVDRTTNMFYVFVKKPRKPWSLLGKDQCATGNPFWETPTGTFRIWKKFRTLKYDDMKFEYVVAFGMSSRSVICAMPKLKDDFFRVGNSCTMGQVCLSTYRAKLLYNNIPLGTKVYIV